MFGRRGVRCFAAAALIVGALSVASSPATAQTTTTAPYGPAPKAYIVVDHATGAVISASNERTPLPPASLTKIVTALATVAALGPEATVPITERAAGMPAHKLNMKAGEVWAVGDVLSSLLASSANDAAVALAERVSGSLDDFHLALSKLAAHLQMGDAPVLQDPAGLDDEFSVRGGNMISARDLAIAARALLAEPRLAPTVARPITEFVGPDGVPHRLVNHNKMLSRYPGTIGMKTGYTKRSGRGLIAAATRNGRTQIAVLLNTADTYGWATQLLDAAFAQPIPPTGDRLPAIRPGARIKAVIPAVLRPEPAVESAPPTVPITRQSGGAPLPLRIGLVTLALLALTWCVLRARVVLRRRKRRRLHARRHSQQTPRQTEATPKDPAPPVRRHRSSAGV